MITPLDAALRNGDPDAGTIIASNCSETQLRLLLHPARENILSVFVKCFITWAKYRREPKLLSGFEWLSKRDGLHFYFVDHLVWEIIFS